MRRSTHVCAMIALTSAALLVPLAAQRQPPGEQNCEELAAPATEEATSRNCEGLPIVPGALPQGVYKGKFTRRGFAEQPGQQNRVMVTLEGTLTIVVSDTGSILAGTAATAEFQVQQGAREGEEMIRGFFTDGSGTLTKQGESTHTQFSVEGTLSGEVLSFARSAKTGEGGSIKAPTVREARVDFTIDEVLCATASGTLTAPLVDETLAGFAAEGMTVNSGSGRWFVSETGERARFTESVIRPAEKAIAETVKMGVEGEQLAGPARRNALSRFSIMDAEINGPCPYVAKSTRPEAPGRPEIPGRCLLCFKRCPTPQERVCLRRMWTGAYIRTMSRWIEHTLGVIARTNVKKSKPETGWANPMAYDGLQSYLVDALQMDRDLALLGVDRCTAPLQQQVFLTIERGLSRLLQRMIDERRPAQDILSVGRQAELLGEVSPRLACRAWQGVRAEARVIRDDALRYLRKRAPKNWDLCDADLRRAWDLGRHAENQLAKLGGPDATVLEYAEAVRPRESTPGCAR